MTAPILQTPCGEGELRLRIDVTPAAQALGEPAHIAAGLLLPSGPQPPHALLVCLPGGATNRRYFDLPTPQGHPEASFARAMAARGFAVAWLDPLGVGESTVPRDPYLLGPDLTAAANGLATRLILDGLRQGTLSPAWPGLRSIGVGHSYGALLTVIQQAAERTHAALAAFGFHTAGLDGYLAPEERDLDPAAVRADIAAATRRFYPEPYVTLQAPASRQAVSAESAMEPLLVTTRLPSRLPGMIAADAATIDVPILLAFGDKDMHPATHEAPASYPKCPDLTLVVLPGTRHNHFIYPTRTFLADRMAQWARTILA
jgi:alpha-beta hydrolase superfamily lysophospholipase